MSIWIILSWVFVALLTGINVVVFLKLKNTSEQMLKMIFPGTKNMQEAMSKVQQMMGPLQGGRAGGASMEAQMRAAMQMLQKAQKSQKR